MKRLTKFVFTILPVCGVISSCNSHKHADNSEIATFYEIEYSKDNPSNYISSIVDSLEFLPLYGSIENPISHVDGLQVTENGIYIQDKRKNILHVYDKAGNRRFTLQSKGHASQEYLEIACFAVTDSSIFIVDNYGQKINEYRSDDGVFKNTYTAPIVIGDIRPLGNGDFILAEFPLEGVNILEGSDGHRLYVTDKSFIVKSSFLPFGNQRDKIGMGQFMSDNDSCIIYSSTGYNGFTKISAQDGSPIGNVCLNTPKPFNNEEIAGMNLSDAMNLIEKKQWQFLTTAPLQVGKYIHLSVKNNEVAEPAIYNEGSNQLYFNHNSSWHNNMIAPDDAHGDSFYVLYNFGGDFLDEQLKMGFNKPTSIADSIIRNDGAVLLRYRMKTD